MDPTLRFSRPPHDTVGGIAKRDAFPTLPARGGHLRMRYAAKPPQKHTVWRELRPFSVYDQKFTRSRCGNLIRNYHETGLLLRRGNNSLPNLVVFLQHTRAKPMLLMAGWLMALR